VDRLPRHTLRVIVVGLILGIALVLIVSSSSASKSPLVIAPVNAYSFHDIYYEDLVKPTRTADTALSASLAIPTASPSPTVKLTAKPTAKPKVVKPKLSSDQVSGVATWYCLPGTSRCTRGFSAGGAYGAAGPELRSALGPNWRGTTVYVNGIPVKLIDFCACGGNHVVDVYHSTWLKIPNQSHVTIRW